MSTLDKNTQEISRLELLIEEKNGMLANTLISDDVKRLIREDIHTLKLMVTDIKQSMNGPADNSRVLKIQAATGKLLKDMKLEDVPEDLFSTSEESHRIGEGYSELVAKGGVHVAGVVYVVVPSKTPHHPAGRAELPLVGEREGGAK